MLLRSFGRLFKSYPLLTIIGTYGGLYLLGQSIVANLYGQNSYEFGDATILTLESLAAFLGKPLGECEVGELTAASVASLERAFKRAIGRETREAIGFEGMLSSFFRQAAVLLQRCLDAGFLSAEEAEIGAEGDENIRVAVAAAVLLNTACRSVDDDVAREADAFVTADGGIVDRVHVPDALQRVFARTIEAKALLREARPDAVERARLCRAVVRAGVQGGSGVSEPVAAALLESAAALRKALKSVFDGNMEDVFATVVEDRWGHFDDGALGDHLLPARKKSPPPSPPRYQEHASAV